MNSKPLKSEDAQNCSITRTIQAHENVPQAGYKSYIYNIMQCVILVILCHCYII